MVHLATPAAIAVAANIGEVLEVLALAVGTGAGVGLGVRLALLQRLRRSELRAASAPVTEAKPPIWGEAQAPEWQPANTASAPPSIPPNSTALLFATAVGFALIGFFCGSLSGFAALVVLQGVRFLATGLAIGIANLITGLVAGVIAGYLVEALGRRWQVVSDDLRGIRQRTAVIALAAGVVMGLLLGLLDTFGFAGTLLSLIGVSVFSVAASLAVQEVILKAPNKA